MGWVLDHINALLFILLEVIMSLELYFKSPYSFFKSYLNYIYICVRTYAHAYTHTLFICVYPDKNI